MRLARLASATRLHQGPGVGYYLLFRAWVRGHIQGCPIAVAIERMGTSIHWRSARQHKRRCGPSIASGELGHRRRMSRPVDQEHMKQRKTSWTLTGWGFSTACLHRLSAVRAYIPSHFRVQQVIPGYTLGGYYGLHYDDSPIGPYDELIVFPGLVAFGGKVGHYVSHSFVNNERALQGGLHSWRWPRELRRMASSSERHRWRFELFEAGQVIFSARGRILTPALPLHYSIPFIDDVAGQVVWYSGLFDTQLQLSSARIKVDPDCRFGRLARGRQLVSVSFKALHVVLGLPAAVPAMPLRRPAYATPAISANGISHFGSGKYAATSPWAIGNQWFMTNSLQG